MQPNVGDVSPKCSDALSCQQMAQYSPNEDWVLFLNEAADNQ